MIAPSAIRTFLARSLDNFDCLKRANSKSIDKHYDTYLKSSIACSTEPMLHQKVCLLIGTAFKRFLFFLDMGTGKSKIALDLIRYHRDEGTIKRALVVVPNKSNIQGWLDEAEKHQPSLRVLELKTLDDLEDSDVDVFVLLYIRVVRLLAKERENRGGKVTWRMDDRKVINFAAKFQCLILDESTAIKNSKSLAYKMCDYISARVQVCYALTGTPHGRNVADLWAQFKVVDRGETLGATLGLFREAFFTKREKMSLFRGARRIRLFDYVITKDKIDKLNNILKHRSIRYETDECVSLPPVVSTQVVFVLGDKAREQYQNIIADVYERDSENIRKTFSSMRQAVGGFLYVRPTDEEREVVELDKVNERIVALRGVIQGLPEDAMFIIFHEFIHSGDNISTLLDDMGIKHGRIFSGTKNVKEVMDNFNKTKKLRCLSVNNQSGAFGLNLQVANYAIFYESPVSPIIRVQAERRIHRVGQTRTAFYYDIVAANSVDMRIRQMVMEGKDLLEQVVNGRIKL